MYILPFPSLSPGPSVCQGVADIGQIRLLSIRGPSGDPVVIIPSNVLTNKHTLNKNSKGMRDWFIDKEDENWPIWSLSILKCRHSALFFRKQSQAVRIVSYGVMRTGIVG